MEKLIKKKMMVEKEVTIGRKVECDRCHTIIMELNGKVHPHYGYTYYHLTTGHHDWGNDSIESIEENDLCSDKCLMEQIQEFLEEEEDSHTKYFRVESVN